MSSSWSVRRGPGPQSSRLMIERAHDELLAGNADDQRLLDVRALVRESWQRSVAGAVRADGLPPLDLAAEELENYRRSHPLAEVMDMIRGLLLPGDPGESGVVVAVGDATGRLLWVEGDRSVRSLTGEMGFVAGANWSEQAVGTSAPGTALALGRSVQIDGAEHFNRFVQPWSCSAAPVHDPETRRIIGVIDVTGGAEAVTPQAQLLVDATARAVESELMITRMRSREQSRPVRASRRTTPTPPRAELRVLGRHKAELEVHGASGPAVVELTQRHAEILLMLSLHRQGLSSERLADLVYGEEADPATLRPEIVRLRKVLSGVAGGAVELASRPYRLTVELTSDAHTVLALLDRGAHRVALASYHGDLLAMSDAPGVREFRRTVRAALREALMGEASAEVLLSYADTLAHDIDDRDLLVLLLELLPARSPKRAGIVARIEKLDAEI